MAMPQKTISKLTHHLLHVVWQKHQYRPPLVTSSSAMYHSCVFPSARQHVLVELGELASCWRLEAQVLRGALEVFLVISGGIVLASFGRVPFPGPGIKWRDQFAPAKPRRNRLWRFRRSLEPAHLSAPRKKSASLIFFFLLI